MNLLRELAESLTKPARRLLLRDGDELQRENARTREFIEKFRLPNPLRALHARAYRMTRVGTKPAGNRLLPDDRAVVDELCFHFSGEYESFGVRVDRWIGPDGCIYIECSSNRRFMSVLFEDDHRISMQPDLTDDMLELFPTTEFLVNSHDLVDDYRRMLEKTADYLEATPTRLVYRYADSQLDLDCVEFYLRHQTPLEFVRFAMSSRFWSAVSENFPGIGEGAVRSEEARDLVASLDSTGRITDEDVALSCRSCHAAVYVAFDEIGTLARCPECKKQVATGGNVLFVYAGASMQRLLNAAKLPAVVCFWSPESWLSTMSGAATLHDATIKSGTAFVSLLVDVTVMDEVAGHREVDELPTFIRFEAGRESGRHVGPLTVDGVRAFANPSAQ